MRKAKKRENDQYKPNCQNPRVCQEQVYIVAEEPEENTKQYPRQERSHQYLPAISREKMLSFSGFIVYALSHGADPRFVFCARGTMWALYNKAAVRLLEYITTLY